MAAWSVSSESAWDAEIQQEVKEYRSKNSPLLAALLDGQIIEVDNRNVIRSLQSLAYNRRSDVNIVSKRIGTSRWLVRVAGR